MTESENQEINPERLHEQAQKACADMEKLKEVLSDIFQKTEAVVKERDELRIENFKLKEEIAELKKR